MNVYVYEGACGRTSLCTCGCTCTCWRTDAEGSRGLEAQFCSVNPWRRARGVYHSRIGIRCSMPGYQREYFPRLVSRAFILPTFTSPLPTPLRSYTPLIPFRITLFARLFTCIIFADDTSRTLRRARPRVQGRGLETASEYNAELTETLERSCVLGASEGDHVSTGSVRSDVIDLTRPGNLRNVNALTAALIAPSIVRKPD